HLYEQVIKLINRLLGKGHFSLNGEMERGEYLFTRNGLKVPFPALSDGYRAFLGWIGDLLFHVCMTCSDETSLLENRGMVLVDEIDLHLHPKWQMRILPTLSKALPNIQFILTSHSPLLVGSLEWMNVIAMKPISYQATSLKRISDGIHGLDADQILLSDFFGLSSTRADSRQRKLKQLTLKARNGDTDAARELLSLMSKGKERL
ncbi:MAG: AAA family ATPase, partial [bacterium]|nr:AAA family ATPase [bacterium]